MLLAPSFELRSLSKKRAKPLETSTATTILTIAPAHIRCVISSPVFFSSYSTPFSTFQIALANATLQPSRTHMKTRFRRVTLKQPLRRHQVPRANAPRVPTHLNLFWRASKQCMLKSVDWTRFCAPKNIFKRSTTAWVLKKTALNESFYNTYAMLWLFKQKPTG